MTLTRPLAHTARSVAVTLAATLTLALPSLAAAADWPQWRGQNRDGKSAETGLLQSWPEGGPTLAWRAAGSGGGYGSLAVAEGRVFTLGDLADGQYVVARKEDGGEVLWQTKVGPVHDDQYGGARSTPTVDGERLYVETTAGDVVCLEVASGEERWRRSLPTDFKGTQMKAMGEYDWRFSESVLVDEGRVIVTPGHIEAFLAALDKLTGAELWRTKGTRIGPLGSDGAAYSSPVVSTAGGRRQYVQLVGRGLIGVDAATGKLLWGYNKVANDIANIPTPLVVGDFVFSSTGYGTGSALVKLVESAGEEGPEWNAEEVYFLEASTLQNHHGGLILNDGTVYTGSGHNKGFPIAADFATGKILWGPERNEGKDSAAVTYADGRLYFRYQDGRMILVEATPEAYREHGTFMIPDVVKQSWSHPVVANGKLYLREQDDVFAYDVTATEPAATQPAATKPATQPAATQPAEE